MSREALIITTRSEKKRAQKKRNISRPASEGPVRVAVGGQDVQAKQKGGTGKEPKQERGRVARGREKTERSTSQFRGTLHQWENSREGPRGKNIGRAETVTMGGGTSIGIWNGSRMKRRNWGAENNWAQKILKKKKRKQKPTVRGP